MDTISRAYSERWCNLNRHNAYGVLVAIFRIASEAVLAGQVLQQHIATASRGSDVVGA